MKTIILLDLSPSFMYTEDFKDALKQIHTYIQILPESELEIYGFTERSQKLTMNDIDTLIEVFIEKKERCIDIESTAQRKLGFGTHFKPMKDIFRRCGDGLAEKVVIYSDFMLGYEKEA